METWRLSAAGLGGADAAFSSDDVADGLVCGVANDTPRLSIAGRCRVGAGAAGASGLGASIGECASSVGLSVVIAGRRYPNRGALLGAGRALEIQKKDVIQVVLHSLHTLILLAYIP